MAWFFNNSDNTYACGGTKVKPTIWKVSPSNNVIKVEEGNNEDDDEKTNEGYFGEKFFVRGIHDSLRVKGEKGFQPIFLR